MKTPLFHLQYEIEHDEAYTENGADNGAKLSIDDIVAMCDELFEAHKGWMPEYH